MADQDLQDKLDNAEDAVKSGNHKVHDVMYETAFIQGQISAEKVAKEIDENTDEIETQLVTILQELDRIWKRIDNLVQVVDQNTTAIREEEAGNRQVMRDVTAPIVQVLGALLQGQADDYQRQGYIVAATEQTATNTNRIP